MSHGALKVGDEYLSLSGEVVRATDFNNTQYIAKNPLLTEGLGIPESAIPKLNAIIGNFLIAIQEASFINRRVLEVVPLARNEWEEPVYPDEPLAYSSTLPAITLVGAVRQNIGRLVRDILALIPASGAERAGDDNGATQKPKEEPFVRNEALIFSANGKNHDELNHIDLLTDEARDLIKKYGTDFVEAIDDMLRNFSESILCRADLSFTSLTCDITRLAKHPEEGPAKIQLTENTPYSTLNPIDFIKMAKRNLEYSPVGLVMRLPEKTQAAIFARLPKTAESAATVTSIT